VFIDEEIATIAAFLHEERETAISVVPDETDPQEEKDIDWDGEDDIRRSDPQMIPPLTTFNLKDCPKILLMVSPLYKGLTNGNMRKVIGDKLRSTVRGQLKNLSANRFE
jgi:hypothetical protein